MDETQHTQTRQDLKKSTLVSPLQKCKSQNAFQNKKGLFHSPFFSYENEKSVVWPGFSTKSGVFLRKKTMFLFNITLFLMIVSFNATTFYNSRTELEKVDHTFREVDDINKKKNKFQKNFLLKYNVQIHAISTYKQYFQNKFLPKYKSRIRNGNNMKLNLQKNFLPKYL